MATIVEHKESGKRYLLLGCGFGVDRDKRGFFDAKPPEHIEIRYHDMICCSDKKGSIGWFRAGELKVLEVDGLAIAEFDITD